MKSKKHIAAFITVFCFCINYFYAQDLKRITEHHQELKAATTDSAKITALTKLADKYSKYNLDSTLKYANQAIKYANQAKRGKGIAYTYNSIGDAYWYKSNYIKAQENYFKAYQISDSINDKETMALSLYSMGWVYCVDQRDLTKIHYLHKANQFYFSVNDSTGISNSYSAIANSYIENYHYDVKNKSLYDSALHYCQKLKEIKYLELYNSKMLQLLYYSNDFKSAIFYGNRALEINNKNNKNDENNYLMYINLCKINLNETTPSILNKIEALLDYYKNLNALQMQTECLKGLALFHYKTKDYKKAYEYGLQYYDLKNQLDKSIYSSQLSSLTSNYEIDKSNKKVAKVEHEKELEEQKNKTKNYLLLAVFAGAIALIGFAYSLRKQNKQKHEANKLLEVKNHIIEEKQKEILDSINYAKRIQDSLLASNELIKKYLPTNFIYFNPKDIVSGDFYWATEHNNCLYLAVCDSTGHGVPGAFMSFLNMAYLSEAISEKNIEAPHEIINYVRNRLINTISKDGQKDGMDGILFKIEKINNTIKIEYTAANNAPILITDNTIIEQPKDKMPIGKGEKTESFSTHALTVKKGNAIYLYTDGYADQFGGEKGKKFKYKPFNEMLLANHTKSTNEQHITLKHNFNNWKGNLEQVDDVLVMGIVI